jgi:hypothetical protein
LCTPLNYPALLCMLKSCWLVLTDSGGIQEEAAALHKPVLVLRDSTERAELIAAGGGMLVGTARDTIVSQTKALLAQPLRYEAMRRASNPFGDGRASHYIRDILIRELGLAPQLAAEAGPEAGPKPAPRADPSTRDFAPEARAVNDCAAVSGVDLAINPAAQLAGRLAAVCVEAVA